MCPFPSGSIQVSFMTASLPASLIKPWLACRVAGIPYTFCPFFSACLRVWRASLPTYARAAHRPHLGTHANVHTCVYMRTRKAGRPEIEAVSAGNAPCNACILLGAYLSPRSLCPALKLLYLVACSQIEVQKESWRFCCSLFPINHVKAGLARHLRNLQCCTGRRCRCTRGT